MTLPHPSPDSPLHPALTDSVAEAVRIAFGHLEPPALEPAAPSPEEDGAGIWGVSGLLGEESWTLALFVPKNTASGFIRRILGFDIPFTSSDLEDAAAELTDILASRVVVRLQSRNIEVQRTLPASERGSGLVETLAPDARRSSISFRSSEGPFRVTVFACAPPAGCHLPGT